MKFDTRDTKPKLYNLLILTILVAAVIAILLLSGGDSSLRTVTFLLDAYFAAVVILLIVTFIAQVHYNPYSYNSIFYSGFSLFFLFVLATCIVLTVELVRMPEEFNSFQIESLLLRSAKNYILLTFPFLFLFSVALCISNLSLIKHEGKRLVNLLGILLAFLLVAGELFLFRLDYYITGSLWKVMLTDLFTNLIAALYLYFECMLIGTAISALIAARHEPLKDKDFVIILGCGLKKDGTPTPLLKGRIDRALTFARKQKEETGRDVTFVTSGGQGPNEVISESASMKQYLLEQGVPEDRILEEDRSTSTFENMKFSKEKIDAVNSGGKVAFSTTNYHVFRSGLFARRVKMRAVGMGARTKWYFWPNAAVREFVGLVTEHRLKQVLIFGGMVVFYTVLTFLHYML